jgi:hypothetical protein
MKTLTRFLPVGLMLIVVPVSNGQQTYWDGNGQVYRPRDYQDQYRDTRPWWAGPSAQPAESYRQHAYRPDYWGRNGHDSRRAQEGLTPVHQFVLPENGSTVFTIQPEKEDQFILQRHYVYDGVPFYVLSRKEPGTAPLHRFYAYGVRHFYGTRPDLGERNDGWWEGTLGYIYTQPQTNTVALHAWFNAALGSYHYSTRQANLPPPDEYLGVVGYVIRP